MHIYLSNRLTQLSSVFARSFSFLCSCSPCPPARPNSFTIRLVRSSWSAPTIGVIASTYLCKDCDRSGTGRRGRLSWSWRMQPTAPRWSARKEDAISTDLIWDVTRSTLMWLLGQHDRRLPPQEFPLPPLSLSLSLSHHGLTQRWVSPHFFSQTRRLVRTSSLELVEVDAPFEKLRNMRKRRRGAL